MNVILTSKQQETESNLLQKWKPFLPPDFDAKGAISGGKGVTPSHFFLLLGIGLLLVLLVSLVLSRIFLWPMILSTVWVAVAGLLLPQILGACKVYSPIGLVWNEKELWVLEFGVLDLLREKRSYPLPLSFQWLSSRTCAFEKEIIHLDQSKDRERLESALSKDSFAQPLVEPLLQEESWHWENKLIGKLNEISGLRWYEWLMGSFFVLSFGSWLFAFWVATANPSWVRHSTELPLGIPRLLGDSEGGFYLLSPFYRRIQRYTPQGRFVRGWHLSLPKGKLRYKVDSKGYLHAWLGQKNSHHYLLDAKAGTKKDSFRKVLPDESFSFPDETLLRMERNMWDPRVVRIQDGTLVFRFSRLKILFMAPFPSLLWFFVGLGMAWIFPQKRKNL